MNSSKKKTKGVVDRIPPATRSRWKKSALLNKGDWRGEIYRVAKWFGVLYEAGSRELRGRLSPEQWMALIASMKDQRMLYDPARNEALSQDFGGGLLAWHFVQYCKEKNTEATQFGDPQILSEKVGGVLVSLSPAGAFFVAYLAIGYWIDNDHKEGEEGDYGKKIREYLKVRGVDIRLDGTEAKTNKRKALLS